MFDPSVPPAAGKSTVPMTSLHAGREIAQARPRGRIVAKDQPSQPYRDLLLLPDGRVLAGYRGRFIESAFGLQLRAGEALAVEAGLPGAAGPFSLRGNQLLASGPLYGGFQASVRLVDLSRLAVLDTFPVRRPYLWLGDRGRFLAQTPAFPYFRQAPLADARLLARHPSLRPWVEDRTARLLLVTPGGRADGVLDAAAVGPEYPEFEHLALSPDGTTLYAVSERSVAAVCPADWSLRWRTPLGENDGPRFYAAYALAPSPDGRSLAVGGLAGYGQPERTVVLLDAATGAVTPPADALGRALYGSSVRALAWHPSGWLAAATASGRLAHLDPATGTARLYKGAGAGIESLLFLDAGRALLACGSEKHFRLWPLLPDEAAGPPADLAPSSVPGSAPALRPRRGRP